MTRYIRGVLALVVGAVIFLALAVSATLIGVVFRERAQGILVHVPTIIGRTLIAVVYRGILGMHIVMKQTLRHHRTGQTLVIANHPTNLLAMLLGAHMGSMVGVPLVFVAKHELLNGLIGRTMAACGIGIFIDRSDRAGAIDAIRTSIDSVMRRGCGLGILPDGSRPTPESIGKDHRDLAASVPRIEEFRYTRVPRERGVLACLDGMQSPRVIDITAECSVPTAYWRDVFGMVGSTYTIVIEDVTRFVPPDPAGRKEWLRKRWRHKNTMIAHWRSAHER